MKFPHRVFSGFYMKIKNEILETFLMPLKQTKILFLVNWIFVPCLPEQLYCLDGTKTCVVSWAGLREGLVSPAELAQCLVGTIKLCFMLNSRESSPS